MLEGRVTHQGFCSFFGKGMKESDSKLNGFGIIETNQGQNSDSSNEKCTSPYTMAPWEYLYSSICGT